MSRTIIAPTLAGWTATLDGVVEAIEDTPTLRALDAIDAGEVPHPSDLESLQYTYPDAVYIDTLGVEVGELFPEDEF